jgi:hypothetical protein
MASRLTVVFYIILCLEAGVFLTLLPWVQWFGMGDWGNNYFLVYASRQTGLAGLQSAVASGWVRGAVTGLGLLNIFMGVWEMFHFRETVRKLEGADARPAPAASETPARAAVRPAAPEPEDARRAGEADHLPRHGRRDD